ncbi:glycosyltransferase [Neorhizobium sp. P12A]|uniref:glycosyltransferase family 4 protein n=1 Tax=Neorhizobium sp. P12A TaxID=2268027 RepID=UPI0011EE8F11|nr:glycosyltransferase family 4 protein [Neorhizobium sp. P12A]KAA0700237.1 glycosyltransferase [Neorhizobium sp. P12A]
MNGKVVVSQLGARMHYAVPRIFVNHGQLAHFYTDITATKGWPGIVKVLPTKILPSAIRRLAGRAPKGVPNALTTTFASFGALSAIRRSRIGNIADETSHAVWAGSRFSTLVAKSGFHGASGLYAFSGDALEQMEAAKQQGMWTVVEQMVAPRDVLEELVSREMTRFPEWMGLPKQNPFARSFADRERAEWSLADLILCPSEFVRRHVIACGGPAERCVLLPYGVDPKFSPERKARRPGPLRVLTAGEVGLRKGSPYVAAAAEILGGATNFRMVGRLNLADGPRQELSTKVELKGVVPRAEMAAEFRWADIFLLPSVCEGSATVVYEALASGLPVVTTENTGTVVRDGIEGFIVPVGDPEAIASAIDRFVADDELRAAMSLNATRRASEFTVNEYGKRLVAALSVLPAERHNAGVRTIACTGS